MKKIKYVLLSLMLILGLLSGCNQTASQTVVTAEDVVASTAAVSEPAMTEEKTADENIEEEIETDETQAAEADAEDNGQNAGAKEYGFVFEEDVNAPITNQEQLLGISGDMRKEMIDLFGMNDYWYGVNAAAVMMQTQTPEDSPIYNTAYKVLDPSYTIEQVNLVSDFDGHTIPSDYIMPKGEKNNDTIIFIHGAGESRQSFVNVIQVFLKKGLNVLVYDQRSSGDNTAKYCTYGQYEQYDLMQYISYIDNNLDEDSKLYIYARSQGGVTAGRVLGSHLGNEKIDGAILDCPLESMQKIMMKSFEEYTDEDSAQYLLDCGNSIMTYLFGFSAADAEMTNYIGKTTVPTMVLTSKGDTVVDKEMPIAMYNAMKNNQKYLYVSESAYHCYLSVMEGKIYEDLVDQFLSGEIFKK